MSNCLDGLGLARSKTIAPWIKTSTRAFCTFSRTLPVPAKRWNNAPVISSKAKSSAESESPPRHRVWNTAVSAPLYPQPQTRWPDSKGAKPCPVLRSTACRLAMPLRAQVASVSNGKVFAVELWSEAKCLIIQPSPAGLRARRAGYIPMIPPFRTLHDE